MKQILWASPTLVDRFGFTVFGYCDFVAVLGCRSPAKLTDSKNEPPVVDAFLIVTSASFGGSLGYLGRLTLWYFAPPFVRLSVWLGVWLARVVCQHSSRFIRILDISS